ncbi:MAG: cobalt/nickel transport system ATP-binding protein [Nitrospirae bacterium]|nr:MAG: cobalt/nickel transport system ATP-binding protein [Nitrospirota bacterium]
MDDDVRYLASIEAFDYPDGTRALTRVNLAIRRGEWAAILGSNGSGKTTLLRILDGLLKDYAGSVLLDGTDVRKLSPRQIYSKVGLVFQNPDDQLFAPTVFEDVAFGPRNMGCSEEESGKRVAQALELVDMQHAALKAIGALSFGQKKRICIAGLLAMGHEILLLDEPTAGLDPMGEYRMMHLLQRLNREKGVTIVMATHSVDLVPIFIDSLYILSRGRIARGGTPEEVFTAPDEMAAVKLRLPHIAELIHRLKHEDQVQFGRIPLTVGEARREIIKMLELEGKKQ